MTDASVHFLLEKIDKVLTGEWGLRDRIESDIRNLKSELEMMRAFLKEADNGIEEHPQIMVWVAQVRDNARDIEHVLDLIELDLAEEKVRRISGFRRWATNHFVENLINEIKEKLQNCKKIREGYPSIKNSCKASSSMLADNFSPSFAYLSLKEDEIVGIEDDKSMMISWARNMTDSYRKVLFVTGMGGSGKTTLVKQVFDLVKGYFDCHAWITVSKNPKLILHELLGQLESSRSPQKWPSSAIGVDLISKLHNFLEFRKYVIVLDDLWSNDVWESIRQALPRGNISSRIIVTTQRGDIACSHRDNSIGVHNVQLLHPEKAKQLFHRKAFPIGGSCPQGLLQWSNAILGKCEGLPLAITEIAEVLSSRGEILSEWKKLHDGLVSELRRNARLNSNITKVMMSSYHDLPYGLKCCFLYMNMFPADSPINTRKLIRLWISEGFIEEQTGKELEDVGVEYVKELTARSLIQVSELDFDGSWPKACHIHNTMHAIILSKLQDEAFGVVCSSKEQNGNIWEKNPRRISIQVEDFKMPPSVQVPHCHTLLIFNPRIAYASPSFGTLKLLKILHLQGFNLHKFPEEIKDLLLLRYLCLRNTNIRHIPGFIGKLRHLETLDLKQTMVTKLPKEINNLEKLRHLLVYRYEDMGHHVTIDTVKGFEFSADISGLTNLQNLSFVTAHSHQKLMTISRMKGSCDTIQKLQHLKKLRKLGIIGLSKKDGNSLCETIQCLNNLYSLSLTSLSEEILYIEEISRPPQLKRLYLKGKLERMPTWISKLHDLVRLRLKWSQLPSSSNPIEKLQDLPNLLELQLLDAYTGNLLDFSAGKFQKLKILEFEQLDQLGSVIIRKHTLPCLQKLIIRRCNMLQVPGGIENLICLKELILCDMPENFVKQIRKGGSMHNHVQHIAVIRSYHLQKEVEDLRA